MSWSKYINSVYIAWSANVFRTKWCIFETLIIVNNKWLWIASLTLETKDKVDKLSYYRYFIKVWLFAMVLLIKLLLLLTIFILLM